MRCVTTIAIGATLLFAACGSDSSPEATESQQLPDADELIADAADLGVSPLALALEQTASAAAYRMQMSMGMDWDMGLLDEAMSFPADPATPYLSVEVDAAGEQHVRIEMAPMMDALLQSSDMGGSSTELLGGDLGMEMWQSGPIMLIDMSGFEAVLAQEPGGGFDTEVFTVDLTRLGEGIGGAEMASAFIGEAAPDPAVLLTTLRDRLDEVGADGTSFTGTLSFLDYAVAFGQDPTTMTGVLGDSLPIDLDAMLEAYEALAVDVVVTVDGDVVDTVRFDVDLTSLMAAIPEMMAGASDEPISDDDIEMIAMFLEDATFSMTMLLDYELDPTIDVVVPTGDFPDATDQILDAFGSLLGG